MKTITTNNAPIPAGHYAQAVEHNGFLFISGQLPVDGKTGKKCLGTIQEQTQKALENIEAILSAGNSDKSKVLKVTVYVSDIALWDEVNEVYAAFFGNNRPARAVVPTKDLHYGFKIEIDAIAMI